MAMPQRHILHLRYQPPFNWQAMLHFWQLRALTGMEWVTNNSYGRTFSYHGINGRFRVTPLAEQQLRVELDWPDATVAPELLAKLRQVFDLDADSQAIDARLQAHPLFAKHYIPGLRIPGAWSAWEAGVRAILGQQVSVQAARTQCQRLLDALGQPIDEQRKVFPTPSQVANSNLAMIKVPQARRDTLRALANLLIAHPEATPEQWLKLKGIGPWTVLYVKLRGLSEPDIWLGTDLGIKKALAGQSSQADLAQLAPWRSYATFQLWNR